MTSFERYDRASPATESLALNRAIQAALSHLLCLQNPEGYWLGELEADTSLESDAVLMEYFLGQPDRNRVQRLVRCVREEQSSEGGWSLYPGGPPNINLIVKAYLALRLGGVPESDPALRKAEQLALSLGGVQATNSFTQIYLCLLGLQDWKRVPSIPPEIVLLPSFAYLNIYEISSWSRAILVPLSILYAFQPVRHAPKGVHLRRLSVPHNNPGNGSGLRGTSLLSWKTFFWSADRVLATLEQKKWTPLRQFALKRAEQWLLEHLEDSDGLGAIYPAMMNSILALECLGYDRQDPRFVREVAEFWRLGIEGRDSLRMQPCFSPVWDTALSLFAAAEGGLDQAHPALCKGADWLLSKQVLRPGDWAVKNRKGLPGGWAFEFSNELFPDVDDTAMVLLALSRVHLPDPGRQRAAMRRGLEWVLSMQCSDGGWASFEVDINKSILCEIPYADHNAMLDPSAADITGRVLETLAALGYDAGFPPARRAIQFLRQHQEMEGGWYGRWGVNYIYGTCFALRGLAAIGEDMREAYCLRAAEWLRSCQNPDGGWGESCDSYDNPDLKGIGPSTASQTAWALLGLFATQDYDSQSVSRGVRFLLETQKENGSWSEQLFTGTGFPSVFYLKYHLYSHYFPLLALSEYVQRQSEGGQRRNRLPQLQFTLLS